MPTLEQAGIIASFLFGLYGAALSTYLAYSQRKRKVIMVLELHLFSCQASVVITNVGNRPLSISSLAIALAYQEKQTFFQKIMRKKNWESVPKVPQEKLPVTLADGEHVALPLGSVVSQSLIDAFIAVEPESRKNIKIVIYDTEGKEFSSYKVRAVNEKWGTSEEVKVN